MVVSSYEALIMKYRLRVLFGTDAFPPKHRAYAGYFRFLETDDEYFPYSHSDPRVRALDDLRVSLPEEVLVDVYAGNARRLVPALRAD